MIRVLSCLWSRRENFFFFLTLADESFFKIDFFGKIRSGWKREKTEAHLSKFQAEHSQSR